jgi:hypothetical protein
LTQAGQDGEPAKEGKAKRESLATGREVILRRSAALSSIWHPSHQHQERHMMDDVGNVIVVSTPMDREETNPSRVSELTASPAPTRKKLLSSKLPELVPSGCL